jgi:t-SNARE complex subunit (syntaxin)
MNRKDTIDRLNRQLKSWDSEILRIEKKVQKLTNDLHQRVEDLKKKKESAQTRTEELIHSSEDAWKELRKGAEQAFSDVKKALKKARAKFK